MEKTYDGAVMALPERDEELFRKINEATAGRRQEREAAEGMHLYSDAKPEEVRVRPDLGRVWGVTVRTLIGCVFLGAVARGWCGMEFGLCCAAVCGIWAGARWRRK